MPILHTRGDMLKTKISRESSPVTSPVDAHNDQLASFPIMAPSSPSLATSSSSSSSSSSPILSKPTSPSVSRTGTTTTTTTTAETPTTSSVTTSTISTSTKNSSTTPVATATKTSSITTTTTSISTTTPKEIATGVASTTTTTAAAASTTVTKSPTKKSAKVPTRMTSIHNTASIATIVKPQTTTTTTRRTPQTPGRSVSVSSGRHNNHNYQHQHSMVSSNSSLTHRNEYYYNNKGSVANPFTFGPRSNGFYNALVYFSDDGDTRTSPNMVKDEIDALVFDWGPKLVGKWLLELSDSNMVTTDDHHHARSIYTPSNHQVQRQRTHRVSQGSAKSTSPAMDGSSYFSIPTARGAPSSSSTVNRSGAAATTTTTTMHHHHYHGSSSSSIGGVVQRVAVPLTPTYTGGLTSPGGGASSTTSTTSPSIAGKLPRRSLSQRPQGSPKEMVSLVNLPHTFSVAVPDDPITPSSDQRRLVIVVDAKGHIVDVGVFHSQVGASFYTNNVHKITKLVNPNIHASHIL